MAHKKKPAAEREEKKANFSSRRIRIFFDGNELSEFFNFSIELCVVFFTLLFSEVSREQRAVFVQRVPLCSLVELKEPSKICQNAVEEFLLAFFSLSTPLLLCSAANKPPTRKCNKCFNFSKKSNCFDRGGLSSASWRGSKKKHVGIGTECLLQFFSLLFICSRFCEVLFGHEPKNFQSCCCVFFFVSLLLLPYAE